jgi:hypothetical protein
LFVFVFELIKIYCKYVKFTYSARPPQIIQPCITYMTCLWRIIYNHNIFYIHVCFEINYTFVTVAFDFGFNGFALKCVFFFFLQRWPDFWTWLFIMCMLQFSMLLLSLKNQDQNDAFKLMFVSQPRWFIAKMTSLTKSSELFMTTDNGWLTISKCVSKMICALRGSYLVNS